MNQCINKILNPKMKQWLWFVGLWFLGLGSVILMTLPIKLLIKACQ